VNTRDLSVAGRKAMKRAVRRYRKQYSSARKSARALQRYLTNLFRQNHPRFTAMFRRLTTAEPSDPLWQERVLARIREPERN